MPVEILAIREASDARPTRPGGRAFSVLLSDDGRQRTYRVTVTPNLVANRFSLLQSDESMQEDFQYRQDIVGRVTHAVARFARGIVLNLPLAVDADEGSRSVA